MVTLDREALWSKYDNAALKLKSLGFSVLCRYDSYWPAPRAILEITDDKGEVITSYKQTTYLLPHKDLIARQICFLERTYKDLSYWK